MDIVIVIIAMYVLNKITLKVINKEKDIIYIISQVYKMPISLLFIFKKL